jgi:cyclopropane-fatty-acyl-phospholipid synthase
MADGKDLDFTYTQIDKLFRLSLGEMADFSGAKYDGDFSLTLEEAQARKHAFVLDSLGVREGSRVLDLGCGWGPMLRAVRDRGAIGVGVTLSRGQATACRRNGLDVHLHDCRAITPATFGTFDAVVSLGAFEHFCSVEEWRAGRQAPIYNQLFGSVAALLPDRGRFFLQTMVFGRRMIPHQEISLDAPPDSDAYMLGLMTKQFPGSWLPYGSEQLEETARPFFTVCSRSSGRLDYIETIRQWRRRFARRSLRKLPVYLSLLPRWATSRDFRLAFTSGVSANSVCFERELLDHFRIVFEKAQPA